MHLEKLKSHLRWLNGDTKEPNVIKLDKETIENILKELEDHRYKIDKIKECLIRCEIYLDEVNDYRKSLLKSIQNTIAGL